MPVHFWKLLLLLPLGALACSSPSGSDGVAGGGGGGSAGSAASMSGSGGTPTGQAGSGTSAGAGGAVAGGGAGTDGGGGASGGAFVLDFGPNVLVFDPATPMANMQAQIDAAYASQLTSQFGDKRYAFLFKPGAYQLDVKVGYYTQAVGLGQTPDEVQISGAVRSTGINNGNATLSFWRGVENLSVLPMPSTTPNMWAVSQGASFRRVHVFGSLLLADTGNSSGGFVADSKIESGVTSASQQQYFLRNSEWKAWQGGVWNMVFTGDPAAPTAAWPASPYTVVQAAPSIREKPFLFLDPSGKYAVRVPALEHAQSGISWGPAGAPGTALPIDAFFVAHDADSASTINAALAQGKHLLLTPGVYHLSESISITRADTVVLGLGLPTLIAEAGKPAIQIADVSGVKLAGVLVQAGAAESSTLIEVGPAGASMAHADNPTLLSDVYCRVGGAAPGVASSCMVINSKDVIGDNLWLWRADHGTGVGWTSNKSKNGLIVNGDGVTLYGLFVEHFQEYQTIWNGNGGHVYFYQSELPYDPPTQTDWQHDGVNGYASYKVADTVTTHEAWGMGVYSAFRQPNVVADNAFETPSNPGVALHHLVTVWLNGQPTTAINHVINGSGSAVTQANRKSTID